MEKSISAADANRNFSTVLREVREGHSYIVTTHGKPVAKILPVNRTSRSDTRSSLLTRLRSEEVCDAGPWRRDEIYEKDQ
jgi:prevent-host-death family protein